MVGLHNTSWDSKVNYKKAIKQAIACPYYYLYQRFLPTIGNRTLIYHSIGTKLPWGEYGISIEPQVFKEHITYLAKNYRVISSEDILTSLDSQTVCITLDDGYKDNLLAYEVFEEFQIPFTIFISTQFISQQYWLNQEEIKRLASSPLCTLGAHGHSHTKLATLSSNQQDEELRISKQILEDIVGKEISMMSFPHGSYDTNTLRLAKDMGYKLCFSSHIGLNSNANFNPLILKRSEIIGSDTPKDLANKINGFYDFLALKDKL